ncbi:MAG: carboxypeptidase regulatory-like domain-containing protein [bacterium]
MRKLLTLMVVLLFWSCFIACGGGGETESKKPSTQAAKPAPVTSGAYQSTAVTAGGTIAGKATFAGAIPEKKKLQITKDANVCGKETHYDESIVVSGGKGLANVVVKITNISKGKEMAAGTYELDQNGCVFKPHVTLVPVDAELTIKNSDGILHNIHTYSESNQPINVAQPGFRKIMTQSFSDPEVVRVACDVHNWMTGYIVVTDHPYYAITDVDGNFELTNVPAGTYTLEFWQENLGKQTQEVTVEAGATVEANVEFGVGS